MILVLMTPPELEKLRFHSVPKHLMGPFTQSIRINNVPKPSIRLSFPQLLSSSYFSEEHMSHIRLFNEPGSPELLLHVSHDDKGKTAKLKRLFPKQAQKVARPGLETDRPTEPIDDLIVC